MGLHTQCDGSCLHCVKPVGQHPSERRDGWLALRFFDLFCRSHCSAGDLLMLRFSSRIYGLLKPSLAKFLTLTSKQRKKVKMFLRNEI